MRLGQKKPGPKPGREETDVDDRADLILNGRALAFSIRPHDIHLV